MLEVGTLPRITPIPSFPSRRGRREAAGTRRGRPSGCRGRGVAEPSWAAHGFIGAFEALTQ